MVRTLDKGTKLVVATHNEGKLKEIIDLISPFGLSAISAGQLNLPEPEENGTSFEENAKTKALVAAQATNMPALSDDSGLEVDILNNAPGVYTADWATKPDGTRDFNLAMQLVETALVEKNATEPKLRTARFVATLCLGWPDGHVDFFRGEAHGTLIWPPRGEQGFGYDPVFQPLGYDQTFGEMSAQKKHSWQPGQTHALSHRAKAFKLFAEACLSV